MSISNFLIASLDPGGTTGVASYRLPPKGKQGTSSCSYDYMPVIDGHEFGPNAHYKELWVYLTNLNPDVVICENFNAQDNPAVLLISLKYIGVVELYCALTNKPLSMRNREFKDVAWLTDAALMRLGFYKAASPHRNDATKHLIHYIVHDLKRKEILEGLKNWSGATQQD